jgi:hypothetical protein
VQTFVDGVLAFFLLERVYAEDPLLFGGEGWRFPFAEEVGLLSQADVASQGAAVRGGGGWGGCAEEEGFLLGFRGEELRGRWGGMRTGEEDVGGMCGSRGGRLAGWCRCHVFLYVGGSSALYRDDVLVRLGYNILDVSSVSGLSWRLRTRVSKVLKA